MIKKTFILVNTSPQIIEYSKSVFKGKLVFRITPCKVALKGPSPGKYCTTCSPGRMTIHISVPEALQRPVVEKTVGLYPTQIASDTFTYMPSFGWDLSEHTLGIAARFY